MPISPEFVLTVLSCIAVVTSAVAVARASLAKGTIDVLRENNEALAQRVDILEADKARNDARIVALEAENKTLRTLTSSTVAVEAVAALAAMTATQHTEVMALLKSGLHTHNRRSPT